MGFKVSRGNRPLIDISAFTVRLAEGGELAGAASLEKIERSKIDEKFSRPWGNRKEVANRSELATAHLVNRLRTKWDVDLAAFDNSVTWYVGGMTDWTSRKLSVPLDFLAPGQYEARLYVDGSMKEDEPNAIQVEVNTAEPDTSLPISMAPGGGFTAIIAPRLGNSLGWGE